MTNTGTTVINGNVGVSPGTAVTGFPPGIVTPPYTIYRGDAVAGQAQSELTTAYNILAGRPASVDLTGQDLGGLTLAPGVYNFNTSAQLTGDLTFDAAGDPNAVFIIKVGSTLTTASASRVRLINGAQAGNVFFQVGSSATLGTDTEFRGKILALTSITLNTRATVDCGAALARNGAVTLDTNRIGICPTDAGPIEPGVDDDTSTDADDTPTDDDDTPTDDDGVVEVINGVIADDETIPLAFELLTILTPAELSVVLPQISGEVATGVAPTGFQAMDSFLNMMVNPGPDGSRPGAVTVPSSDAPVSKDTPLSGETVRVLGYGPAKPVPADSAIASFDQAITAATLDTNRWEVWAGAYGGHNDTDSGDVGTHDRSSSNFGVATGFDYRIASDSVIGFALGGGGTNFELADHLGSGSSDMLQVAVYARENVGPAYIASALAYAYHDVSTDRYVTFAGLDHFEAEFSAHNGAGQIEAGYRFGWFTPFAALRGQVFATPSYEEKTVSGNSTFALAYDERTTVTARTELGARIDWATSLGNQATLAVHTRAAWAHRFENDNTAEAAFQALPGSDFFVVTGASTDSDSLLFSAGAEIGFDNGFALAGAFDGEFAENSQTYTGSGRLIYRW